VGDAVLNLCLVFCLILDGISTGKELKRQAAALAENDSVLLPIAQSNMWGGGGWGGIMLRIVDTDIGDASAVAPTNPDVETRKMLKDVVEAVIAAVCMGERSGFDQQVPTAGLQAALALVRKLWAEAGIRTFSDLGTQSLAMPKQDLLAVLGKAARKCFAMQYYAALYPGANQEDLHDMYGNLLDINVVMEKVNERYQQLPPSHSKPWLDPTADWAFDARVGAIMWHENPFHEDATMNDQWTIARQKAKSSAVKYSVFGPELSGWLEQHWLKAAVEMAQGGDLRSETKDAQGTIDHRRLFGHKGLLSFVLDIRRGKICPESDTDLENSDDEKERYGLNFRV
jgi:hypothetical protein